MFLKHLRVNNLKIQWLNVIYCKAHLKIHLLN